jgi:hypothetical protein
VVDGPAALLFYVDAARLLSETPAFSQDRFRFSPGRSREKPKIRRFRTAPAAWNSDPLTTGS